MGSSIVSSASNLECRVLDATDVQDRKDRKDRSKLEEAIPRRIGLCHMSGSPLPPAEHDPLFTLYRWWALSCTDHLRLGSTP
eukprot:scaffold84278_cov35-Tisochrysis_lutea.AAC.3